MLGSQWDSLQGYYDHVYDRLYENADVRTKDLMFMRRLDGVILLTVGYIALTIVGPRLMMNYKALDLKWPMFVYNMAMAAFALWLFLEMIVSTWQAGYNYVTDNYGDHLSLDPKEVRVAHALWWYYVSKPVEFVDTLFMVLKKKNSQITVLHVWHHAFMFPFLFFGTLIGPCGGALVAPTINCLVHAVMYTYYGLSLFPSLHPYLGWKKYLTQFQLAQFFLIIAHVIYGVSVGVDYPTFLKYTELTFICSLVVLFGNFYFQAYLKRKQFRPSQPIPPTKAGLKEKKDL